MEVEKIVIVTEGSLCDMAELMDEEERKAREQKEIAEYSNSQASLQETDAYKDLRKLLPVGCDTWTVQAQQTAVLLDAIDQRHPVAYIRKHPDGTLTSEVLCVGDVRLSEARINSGAWQPMYIN